MSKVMSAPSCRSSNITSQTVLEYNKKFTMADILITLMIEPLDSLGLSQNTILKIDIP